MMKKNFIKFAIFIVLFIMVSEVYSIDPISEEFNIVFGKVGISRFYFTEPDDPNIVKENAIMPISSVGNSIVSTRVGIAWELYPTDVAVSGKTNMELSLFLSASNTVEADSTLGYMMHNIDNADTVNIGFNYDAEIEGSTKLRLLDGDYNQTIEQTKRKLTLFSGPVDAATGKKGTAVVKLSIDSGKIDVISGTYRGYLMLYLESD